MRRFLRVIGPTFFVALVAGILAGALVAKTNAAGIDGANYAVIAPTFNGSDGNLSYIRLTNGGSAATTYNITVLGSPSGAVYGTTSIQVQPYASPQTALSDILSAAKAGTLANGDTSYSLYLQNTDANLSYQHVIYNGGNGFFENATACQSSGKNETFLTNVHTSQLSAYPSQVFFHNFSPAAGTYDVAIYDNNTGSLIGTVPISVSTNATFSQPFTWFQQQLNWTPTASQQHANMVFTATGTTVDEGLVEVFIYNQRLTAYVNMTSRCGMGGSSDSSGGGSNNGLGSANINVTFAGTGSGTVTSSPAGINCGPSPSTVCSYQFNPGAPLTLTANPGTGTSFVSWGGACSGTGTTCTVNITNTLQNVTATFSGPSTGGNGGSGSGGGTTNLAVTPAGNGNGYSITSSPAGINCGPTPGAVCMGTFSVGAVVTLTPNSPTGTSFAGWSGACSGTGACVVTIKSSVQNVTGTFNRTGNLNAAVAGSGSGSITSSPAGINCSANSGSVCLYPFSPGSMVTLTANPSNGSTFVGWDGGICSGLGTCVLTMTSATQGATAIFNAPGTTYTLNLTGSFDGPTGAGGSGNVLFSPAPVGGSLPCAINNGSCNASNSATGSISGSAIYNAGTAVTLTVPTPYGTFLGWGGDCSGTATCTLTMNANHTVTATFHGTFNPLPDRQGSRSP